MDLVAKYSVSLAEIQTAEERVAKAAEELEQLRRRDEDIEQKIEALRAVGLGDEAIDSALSVQFKAPQHPVIAKVKVRPRHKPRSTREEMQERSIRVSSAISDSGTTATEIVEATGMSYNEVMAALLRMTREGSIRKEGKKYFK